MKNSEQPAYPTPDCEVSGAALQYLGLTKREYFAAMAMQGYLASYGPAEPVNSQHVAEKAVKCAGALLTELEKSNQ